MMVYVTFSFSPSKQLHKMNTSFVLQIDYNVKSNEQCTNPDWINWAFSVCEFRQMHNPVT